MRFNQDSLKYLAQQSGDKEGKLMYKAPKEGYHNRWLKLKSNLLFIFKINDQGCQLENDPTAVLVLEHLSIKMELPDQHPFMFSICFDSDRDKKHYFSGQSEQHCTEWLTAMQNISHSRLKAEFEFLRSQVKLKTGKDPVDNKLNKISRNKINGKDMTPRSSFSNLQPSVLNKFQNAPDRHTVGASAFYEYNPPALQKNITFPNWETFD